jgi:hypothetical protein
MSSGLLNSAQESPIVGSLELQLGGAQSEASRLLHSRDQGRATVLLVFGIDCGTCKVLAGQLSSMQQLSQVDCIGVCVQNGCADKLASFKEQLGLRFPLASCRQNELCRALCIPRSTWLFYPTLIFVDAEHRRRGYFVGGSSFYSNLDGNLRVAIEELLQPEQSPICLAGSAVEVEA